MNMATSGYAFAQQNSQNSAVAAPTPTRFSSCAGQLEARVAHLAGMIDRFSRVADRLGGSVPEEIQKDGKLRGQGACVASQLEASLGDFDELTRRAERTLERLEQL